MVRGQRAVRRSGQPAADAGSLRVPHAVQPGHQARGLRRRARRRRRHRARFAQDLAAVRAHYYLFRGTPTRMWFDWVLSSVFDAPIPLTPGKRRRHLRSHRREAAEAGVPAARAVRALQHRGARHHRIAARRSAAPRHHPQERLAGPGHHRLPARQCRRPGRRRLPRQPEEVQRAHRRRRAARGAAISPRIASAARSSP